VSRTLTHEEPSRRFRIELRLYAGWTKGFTRSDYFKALVSIRETFDLNSLFPSSRVAVSAEIGFGDRLLDGADSRLNAGLGIHLPNTLRQQEAGGRPSAVTISDRALARLQRAETLLAAAGRTEDDDLYDRIGARHDRALRRLLTTPAPHAVALADKIDLLVRHQAWEFTFADAALASLQHDARRLA
jgi:hypothetical protein